MVGGEPPAFPGPGHPLFQLEFGFASLGHFQQMIANRYESGRFSNDGRVGGNGKHLTCSHSTNLRTTCESAQAIERNAVDPTGANREGGFFNWRLLDTA